MTRVIALVKIAYFSVFSIWDNANTQGNKIYTICLVVFGYFKPEILHIVFLSRLND